MSLTEALREEAKRRATGEWAGKFTKVAMWLQAADYLETLDNPGIQEYPSEVLAEALRAENTRHHVDTPPWEEATEQAKNLWIDKAKRVSEEITKAIQRRSQ